MNLKDIEGVNGGYKDGNGFIYLCYVVRKA